MTQHKIARISRCIATLGVMFAIIGGTPAGAVSVLDQTCVLSRPQLTGLFTKLQQIRDKRGIHLGVVICGELSSNDAHSQAASQRQTMIQRGSLPKVSGILLFSGKTLTWERHTQVGGLLSWDQILKVWGQIPQGMDAPQNAIAFIDKLYEFLGLNTGRKPVTTTPPPTTISTPGTVSGRVCKQYDEVKDQIGPQNPILTLGGAAIPSLPVQCAYMLNGVPHNETMTTNNRGEFTFKVPFGVLVSITARGETKTATCTVALPQGYLSFGWQGHDAK